MTFTLSGPVTGLVVSGYQGLVSTFGSPSVLLAISAVLVAVAIAEIWVRRCARPPRSEAA